MNNEIFKWIYDSEDKRGKNPNNAFFIGTEEEFNKAKTECEKYWGAIFTNIRKEEPTKQEIREWYED